MKIFQFVWVLLFPSTILAINSIATAGTIAVGQTIPSASLVAGGSGDYTYFKIKLVAGRTYSITVQASIQMTLQLFSGTGVNLARSYGANKETITYTPATTDFYYPEVAPAFAALATTYQIGVADQSACSATCTGCTYPTACPSCTAGYMCSGCSNSPSSLIIGGYCPCIPGEIYDSGSGSCVGCSAAMTNCLSCTSTTVCTSCGGGWLMYNSHCVFPCPSTTYSTGTICQTCQTLNTHCQTCNSSSTCTGCSGGLKALGSTCVGSCPLGTYDNLGVCTSCLTLDNHCSTCNSTVTCTGCSGGLKALGSTCVGSCPSLTTYDLAGVCTSCLTLDNYCSTCNSSVSCTGCSGGLVALGANCIASCPLGTYDLAGICTSCLTLDNYCSTCNSTVTCTGCSGGLKALGANCIASCPLGTYENLGVCTSCLTLSDYCTTCNSTVTCLSCSGGLLALGSTCVSSCPVGTYENNGVCVSCRTLDGSCYECSNDIFCSLCDSGKLIYGPHCVSKCPSGFINNEGICTSTAYQIILSKTSSVTSYMATFPPALVYDIDVPSVSKVTLVNTDISTYKYTMTKRSSTVYQIDFQYTHDISSTLLKLTYTLTGPPTTTNTLVGRWIPVKTAQYMAYMPDSTKKTVSGITDYVKIAMIAVTASSATINILGGNQALVWSLLNLFQILYYLIFINVNHPANVQWFLEIFSMGSFSWMPNPVEWLIKDIDHYDLPVPERYAEFQFSGLFLDNAGNELLFLGLLFVGYLISKAIKKWIRRLPMSVRLVTNRGVEWFEWSNLLDSLVTSYTDMVQAIFLQMRVLTYNSSVFTLSTVGAFITLCYAIVFPILTLSVIRKFPESLEEKFEALVKEFDTKKRAGKYFVPIWLLGRFIMCVSLVFFQKWPFLQISVLCLLMIFSIIHWLGFSPSTSRKENISNTMTEILFGIVHVLIYVLIYDDHNPSFSQMKRLQVGWGIIAVCGVILFISVGLNVIEQIKEYYKGFKVLMRILKKSKSESETKKKNVNYIHPRMSRNRMRTSMITETFDTQTNLCMHTNTDSNASLHDYADQSSFVDFNRRNQMRRNTNAFDHTDQSSFVNPRGKKIPTSFDPPVRTVRKINPRRSRIPSSQLQQERSQVPLSQLQQERSQRIARRIRELRKINCGNRLA